MFSSYEEAKNTLMGKIEFELGYPELTMQDWLNIWIFLSLALSQALAKQKLAGALDWAASEGIK